jgi:hypothetical protein
MYINPKFADQVRVAKPPEETGRRLATFMRGHDEFRVTLSTYEGHDFLRLQQWAPDRTTGDFWPLKNKGYTVRMAELVEFRDVIDCLVAELGLDRKPTATAALANAPRSRSRARSQTGQAEVPQRRASGGPGFGPEGEA